MKITEKTWIDYIERLSAINRKAGQLMQEYIERHGTADTAALIAYANALITKYGEGSAELACQMYDAVAAASGASVPTAEPAEVAQYGEVAKMVNGTKQSTPLLTGGVMRLVKCAGADTTLKNALRDGAEFAWIPHGDTCPFCIVLASRGWQRASKKAIKNGHAEHIHAHCDCEYAIRFNSDTDVDGYEPDVYLEQYDDSGGDINAMRRANYAEHKDIINAKKRAAYAARKGSTEKENAGTIKTGTKALRQFTSERIFQKHYDKHKEEFNGISEQEYLKRANELADAEISDDVTQLVRSDGSVSKYRFSTNEFVVVTADGNIRTYFKPATKEAYWNEELERNK